MTTAPPAGPGAVKMLMNCAAMALAFVVLPENWPGFSAWMCGDDAPPVADDAMRKVFVTCWQKMNSAAGGASRLDGEPRPGGEGGGHGGSGDRGVQAREHDSDL